MKSLMWLCVAMVLLVSVRSVAAEETLSGTLVCAKCALNKPDAHECQDVLIVAEASGAKTEYYITKNDVAEKSGEACTLEIKATVTGTVSERDGKKWMTATRIDKH
jgi:hypothetical protein